MTKASAQHHACTQLMLYDDGDFTWTTSQIWAIGGNNRYSYFLPEQGSAFLPILAAIPLREDVETQSQNPDLHLPKLIFDVCFNKSQAVKEQDRTFPFVGLASDRERHGNASDYTTKVTRGCPQSAAPRDTKW
jgi:hypothetical protein